MSTYDNVNSPLMFIQGSVQSTSVYKRYAHDDSTGLGPSGSNIGIEFSMVIENIQTQRIGSSETRSGAANEYTGLDVKVGHWLTDSFGEKCLQVIKIISKSDSQVSLIAKDVDAFTYKNYRANQMIPGFDCAFFALSDSGKPLISGEDAVGFFGINAIAVDKLQSRFSSFEESERYSIQFETSQNSIGVGQVVTVDNSGNLVPIGHATAVSNYKLGVVVGLAYDNTQVYIKPFDKLIDNFSNPELLSGSVGDTYYASTATPGALTTVAGGGSGSLYFQVRDAIPTKVTSTTINISSDAGDTLVVNGVACVNGARNSAELATDINANTATHFVTASNPKVETSLTSFEQGLNPTQGVITLVSSTDTGANNTFPSISVSDGINTANVTFSVSDGAFPTNQAILTISATRIATDLNAAFVAANVDIVASTISHDNGANSDIYPGLKLTLGAVGTEITITEVAADALGQTFAGAMAIPQTKQGSNDTLLTLTRADGGDILLTGLGTFVNSNGMVSSSSGSPALLAMLGSAGADGADGADGDDGADGAQGIQGPAGADGAAGAAGAQGPQGIQGPAGNDGADGNDGAAGAAGAAGADGADGADGVSVTTAAINGAGKLIITLSSGATVDAGAALETIGDLDITGAKIAADAIDSTKLADDAVDSEHIAAGAVDTEHLAANLAILPTQLDGMKGSVWEAHPTVADVYIPTTIVNGHYGAWSFDMMAALRMEIEASNFTDDSDTALKATNNIGTAVWLFGANSTYTLPDTYWKTQANGNILFCP